MMTCSSENPGPMTAHPVERYNRRAGSSASEAVISTHRECDNPSVSAVRRRRPTPRVRAVTTFLVELMKRNRAAIEG